MPCMVCEVEANYSDIFHWASEDRNEINERKSNRLGGKTLNNSDTKHLEVVEGDHFRLAIRVQLNL